MREGKRDACLFARWCLKHTIHNMLFLLNPFDPHIIRSSETLKNFAKTETYNILARKSIIDIDFLKK